MRTVEEIKALHDAALFRVIASNAQIIDEDGVAEIDECPMVIVEKGSPPIFVCAEPAMTLHLTYPGGKKCIPFGVAPPLCRMAMAYHLGLTAEEAASVGLTYEAAQEALREQIVAWAKEEGVEIDGAGVSDIPPTDPAWGRP